MMVPCSSAAPGRGSDQSESGQVGAEEMERGTCRDRSYMPVAGTRQQQRQAQTARLLRPSPPPWLLQGRESKRHVSYSTSIAINT